MNNIHVIFGFDTYWVFDLEQVKADHKYKSCELQGNLSDYSTASFMQLIIDQLRSTGENKFQLSKKVMQFYFKLDQPDLMEDGHQNTGDPWNDIHLAYYIDSKTKNKWVYEFSRGSGLHGFTGSTYYYHFKNYIFKSNDQLDRF